MSLDNIDCKDWDEAALAWLAKTKAQDNLQPTKPRMKADDYQVGGSHYKNMVIEPWHLAEILLTKEEFIGALKFGVLKYTLRDGFKSGSNDREKAAHYLQKLQETLKDGST